MKKVISFIFVAVLMIVLSSDIYTAIPPPTVNFGDLDGVIRNIDRFSDQNIPFAYTEDNMTEIHEKYYVSYYLINNYRFATQRAYDLNLIIRLQPLNKDYCVDFELHAIGDGNVTNIDEREHSFTASGGNNIIYIRPIIDHAITVTLEEVTFMLEDILKIFGKTLENEL